MTPIRTGGGDRRREAFIESSREAEALERDLTAVAAWLSWRYPDGEHHLGAERHYHQSGRALGYLVVYRSVGDDRRTHRADAEAVLRAMGYHLEASPGADVYLAATSRAQELSNHQRLEAIARVRALMEQKT